MHSFWVVFELISVTSHQSIDSSSIVRSVGEGWKDFLRGALMIHSQSINLLFFRHISGNLRGGGVKLQGWISSR